MAVVGSTGAGEQSAGVVGDLAVVQLRLRRGLVVDDQVSVRELGSGQWVGDERVLCLVGSAFEEGDGGLR